MIAAALAAALSLGVATPATAQTVVFGSGKPLLIRIPVTGKPISKIRVEIVNQGNGRVVNGFVRNAEPSRRRGAAPPQQAWAGRTWSGDVAQAGSYRVRLAARKAGEGWRKPVPGRRFEFRTHVFPVAGEHGDRGPVGEFGAARSGGRAHEGFDIMAPCGRRLLAARAGRITEVGYDPVLYGHYVTLRGAAERYSYFYSHLRVAPPVRSGQRVRAGETVGEIGQTGNAATTPCHLHFEIRDRGRPVGPRPYLERWAR